MSNASLVNFASGETSPKSRGRFDVPSFLSSCRKLVNFIAEVAGPARFRPGFRFRRMTRAGGIARLIPFQLNDAKTYMLEFAGAKLRVYEDEDLVTIARTTVSLITSVYPAVMTVVSTVDLADGDTVILSGIVGPTELNGRQFVLAEKSGSTYQLLDPTTGNGIDASGYAAYISGGTVREVYEVGSPYYNADLADINFAQSRNTMYLTHYKYPPHKLTVDSAGAWTLAVYTRTNNPFTGTLVLTVTGITRGTTTIITFAVGSVLDYDSIYLFAGVVGTVEINDGAYRLGYKIDPGSSPAAFLLTTAGAPVNSSAWTAYTSGGTATTSTDNPITVTFYEGRLVFAGTNLRPNTLFFSRGPNPADGAPRYDDFTGGALASDACFFTLAPASGQVDYIAWATGGTSHMLVGTFGGPFRVSGGGLDEPITATSINIRQIDTIGCEAVMPARGARTFYIQRGGTALRSLKFSDSADDLVSYDLCLNSGQIVASPLVRTVFQAGKPDIVWVLREDGQLAAMTVQGDENIAGWHRHKTGGTDTKFIDVAVLPRQNQDDQVWVVTERKINGVTRRTVEVLADEPVFPDAEDFYTGKENEAADKTAFWNAIYRLQEQYIHVDSAGTYDGSDRGDAAGATLTPATVTGSHVVFTASAAVFVAGDVGSELWKKPGAVTGVGSGRAEILEFISTTVVHCRIDVAFDAATAIAAGDWYFAVAGLSGLHHLEGGVVAVQIDGAVYSDGGTTPGAYPVVTVAHGVIALTRNAAVIHVGIPYTGFLQTQNLEVGGRTGPAQSKPRNIVGMAIRFLNSLGCDYGTDPYNTEKIVHHSNTFVTDRPNPVFSGIRKLPYSDGWAGEEEKKVVVMQRLPLPCTVQFIDMEFDSGDEE